MNCVQNRQKDPSDVYDFILKHNKKTNVDNKQSKVYLQLYSK